MAPAVAWLDALRRWRRRAFLASSLGERIPILGGTIPTPDRAWQRPKLCVTERERQVEFALQMRGAEAQSTVACWDEETRTFTVHAAAARSEPANAGPKAQAGEAALPIDRDWYDWLAVDRHVDGRRAEAFLTDGQLRVIAPRVDSQPMTALPLLAYTDMGLDWKLSSAT